jgi:hypothetical protein
MIKANIKRIYPPGGYPLFRESATFFADREGTYRSPGRALPYAVWPDISIVRVEGVIFGKAGFRIYYRRRWAWAGRPALQPTGRSAFRVVAGFPWKLGAVLLPMEVFLDHFVADRFGLTVFFCRESVRPVSSPFA